MLYIAMSGAGQTLTAQAANAHNLANATTTGFKADLSQFRSMPVFGDGHPSRAYAQAERPAVDLRPGSLQATGRELDMAVDGDGWIAVQAPDGGEAYTRAGDLHLTANGQLQTGAGHPVLGNGGPIAVPPAEKLEIGADGTISIRPLGQQANTLAQVDRVKLVRLPPGELTKGSDGLFRLRDGAEASADGSVRLVAGALESSNVSTAQALVEMIDLARRFELQVKMMQTAEANADASVQMLRLS
jgi:flagellar basal-body rod protein FlgF